MIETPTVAARPGTILLGAYAARSCPVKTQNAFNPTVGMAAAGDLIENNEGLAELFDGGGLFKTAVVEQLINSCLDRVVDLRPMSDSTRSEQIEACYPEFRDFLAAKRRHDPGERFQSDWYRHYAALLS